MSLHSLAAFVLFCIPSVSASFDITSKTNNVVYYGQGPNQVDLINYCQQANIDAIVVSFVDLFPAQADGYPGTNFGNQCSGTVYSGPGYDGVVDHGADALQSGCAALIKDMAACQRTYGKKIFLGLGGGTSGYQLTGATDGYYFANALWGMFGPRNNAWVAKGLPRPFDNDTEGTAVDGFTLDIEVPSTDNQAGYITLASRLRALFPASPQTGLLLTGAPQCAVPDANMGATISAVKFDALFIQFYGTPYCSAASWAQANPSYTPGAAENPSGFSYDSWAAAVRGTASAAARLYIGLAGSGTAVTNSSQYIGRTDAAHLVDAYYCRSGFGGVAVYDATYAQNNVANGVTYYSFLKNTLVSASSNSVLQSCR